MRNCRTDTTHGCPAIGRREMLRTQLMHRQRLGNMRSALDTSAPASQPHLQLYGRDYAAKKRATTEAAFSDLKMIQSIAKIMTRDQKLPERKGPISLNADGRKNEIYRIMKDNHQLLNNIETCRPVVSTSDLLKSNKNRRRHVINASHTMRMAGEYDDEILRFRDSDRRKQEAMRRSIDFRRSQYQRERDALSKSASAVDLRPRIEEEGPPESVEAEEEVQPEGEEVPAEAWREEAPPEEEIEPEQP
mmetsp:Transcript_49911/g.119025  ORF Transcript_49911/g.119025 Transcript_49911/m.119025 type:complete len:247 (+) Transcript_49911:80-820(+)